VVSLTPRPPYIRYPLDRGVGRVQRRSRRCEKNHFPVWELNPGRPARRPSLYRLRYHRNMLLPSSSSKKEANRRRAQLSQKYTLQRTRLCWLYREFRVNCIKTLGFKTGRAKSYKHGIAYKIEFCSFTSSGFRNSRKAFVSSSCLDKVALKIDTNRTN
jgi:hypothetical protein